jgi:subtilase family serine protease
MLRRFLFASLPFISAVLTAYLPAQAQQISAPRTLIRQSINENRRVAVHGSTRPEANPANDSGRVPNDLAMDHLWLLLKRSPEQEAALEGYLSELHDPSSPNFHRWLSAADFGASFGASDEDIQTITTWLQSHGLTVNGVLPNRMLVDFSGSARAVGKAFHTEIHHLKVNGKPHMANMSDQQIPAALEGAVAGVVSLSDIHPRPTVKGVVPAAQFPGDPARYVGASDFATIYNLNSLFAAGVTGTGQTVVVLEDSNVYDTSEWSQFRRLFGLQRPYVNGSFSQIHPALAGSPCRNPGATGDADEATLDAQWASAAAPDASIVLASCDNTYNFGVFTALVNLLNATDAPPAIMSISYGGAEAQQGSGNSFINEVYRQAVAEGVSLYVSSGDSGADNNTNDRRNDLATTGISVNGLASTPYNVAVGGTDFGETFAKTVGEYWTGVNTPTFGTAKSYIPEIPWNNSCASELIATWYGFPVTYGLTGFCNSAAALSNGYVNVTAASGGPSSIYAKPSWQNIFGNPSDGVRDLPDVSLFAAVSVNGTWDHAYMFCLSTPVGRPPASYPCSEGYFFLAGGTSFASPIMAGVQALVNQKTGARWGNPNPVYYSLANNDYGAGGNASCDASLGNTISPNCTFHDITQGDINIVCKTGTPNCFSDNGGAYGVLSTSVTSYQPAYAAQSGWDFATGIGSVNIFNLVMNWPMEPAATASAGTAVGSAGQQ